MVRRAIFKMCTHISTVMGSAAFATALVFVEPPVAYAGSASGGGPMSSETKTGTRTNFRESIYSRSFDRPTTNSPRSDFQELVVEEKANIVVVQGATSSALREFSASVALSNGCVTAPLPEVSVTEADPNIPDEYNRFLGVWKGLWGDTLCSRLAITAVNAEGHVVGFYAWAPSFNSSGGHAGIEARIEDGVIRFGETADFEFTIDKPREGALSGTRTSRTSQGTTFSIVMTRN